MAEHGVLPVKISATINKIDEKLGATAVRGSCVRHRHISFVVVEGTHYFFRHCCPLVLSPSVVVTSTIFCIFISGLDYESRLDSVPDKIVVKSGFRDVNKVVHGNCGLAAVKLNLERPLRGMEGRGDEVRGWRRTV